MTVNEFLKEWNHPSGKLLVHTSGSTGAPKPMWVERRRMEESARITCDFLGLKAGDTALLCLPMDYIAGKMMVARSLVRGMRLLRVAPSGHPMRELIEKGMPEIDFAAMVPLQVYNSLRIPEEKEMLKQIRHLIIGGGAVDDHIAAELQSFPHAVWSTYGMTETLSHIALRRLNGNQASLWYTPFSSVSVSLHENGCLIIDAPKVCDGPLVTNDIAEIRDIVTSGGPVRQFRILGRKDNVVICGGVKIQIEEVEKMLKGYISVPFLITKRADEKFGEVVVMLVQSDAVNSIQSLCERILPKYWQPREYVSVREIPMTGTGKPARKEAEQLALNNSAG